VRNPALEYLKMLKFTIETKNNIFPHSVIDAGESDEGNDDDNNVMMITTMMMLMGVVVVMTALSANK